MPLHKSAGIILFKEEERFEEKLFEYRLKSLIEQKTLISQMLTVLIGGVVLLCFLDAPDYKYIAAGIGVYLVFILIKSLMDTITELNGYLYKREGKEKKIRKFPIIN